MNFRKLWINYALIGLFVFLFLSFIVIFQTDNSQSETILENPLLNRTYQGLQTNLSTFGSTAQGQKGTFEAETPTESFGSLIIFAIVSSGKIFSGMLIAIFNLLIFLPASVLGVSPVVTSVMSSILIITIIFLLWRAYKQG